MLLVNGIMEIQGSDVLVLEGHTPEYYLNCAWSPSASILASAAKERYLWSISDANFGAHRESDPYKVVLGYVPELEYAAVLDWNKSGTVLAIGYDEIVRIWNFNGELKTTLCGHKDSISALKWSKNSKYILTGSHDKTAVLWDVNDSKLLEKYEEHSGGVSDVDWRNNDSFATCTLDGRIRVYEIGMLQLSGGCLHLLEQGR